MRSYAITSAASQTRAERTFMAVRDAEVAAPDLVREL
jgi:hypothetical protein